MFAVAHLKTGFTWELWHYEIGMWGIFFFASQKIIMFFLLKTFIQRWEIDAITLSIIL